MGWEKVGEPEKGWVKVESEEDKTKTAMIKRGKIELGGLEAIAELPVRGLASVGTTAYAGLKQLADLGMGGPGFSADQLRKASSAPFDVPYLTGKYGESATGHLGEWLYNKPKEVVGKAFELPQRLAGNSETDQAASRSLGEGSFDAWMMALGLGGFRPRVPEGRPKPLSAEEKAFMDNRNKPQPNTGFPTLNEQVPAAAPEQHTVQPTPFPKINEPILDPVVDQQSLPLPDLSRDLNKVFEPETPANPHVGDIPSQPQWVKLEPNRPEPITAESHPESLTGVNTLSDPQAVTPSGYGGDINAMKSVRETPFDTSLTDTQIPGVDFNRNYHPLGLDERMNATNSGQPRPLYEHGGELPINKTERPTPIEHTGHTVVIEPDKLTIGGRFARQTDKSDRGRPIQSTNPSGRQRGAVDWGFMRGFAGKAIPLERRLDHAKNAVKYWTNTHQEVSSRLEEAIQKGDLKEQKDYTWARNDAEHELQVAQQHLDRVQSVVDKPGAEVSKFVPRKERGSIGDPKAAKERQEFLKFKRDLPANYQSRAKELWKYKKEQDAAKAGEVTPGQNAEAAIVKVPGLSKIIEEVAPFHEKPLAELKPLMLKQPDPNIGKTRTYLTPGADITGFKTKSLVVRYVGDHVNNMYRRADVRMRNIIEGKDGLKAKFDNLKESSQVELMREVGRLEGKEGEANLTDKTKEAWKALREADDLAFKAENEGRAALGLEPIAKRPNHFPSRWRGDFQIPVLNKDGYFVSAITAPNKIAAAWSKQQMKKLHPDYTYGPVDYRPINKLQGDADRSFQEIIRLYDTTDPEVKVIQKMYEELLASKGFDAVGVKRHFEFKRAEGVGGFEGGKEWLSPEKNAREGLNSFLKYVEATVKWAEIQKTNKVLKELFADPEIRDAQPTAVSYSKTYWDFASGQGNKLTHAIDSVADIIGESTGFGRTSGVEGDRWLKRAITMKFLGWNNLSFAASQLVQPVQMLPHWMTYLADQSDRGYIKGVSTAILAYSKADYDIVTPRNFMTREGQSAWDWAVQNKIFESYMIDKVRNASSQQLQDLAWGFTRALPSVVESLSRAKFYMSIFHQLHLMGVVGKDAYQTAAKITDMGMTNYRLHERPMMYRALGSIGDMPSALTTYKHNYYGQMDAFNVKGRRMSLLPMVGMQLIAGGLTGMVGMQEADMAIDAWNMMTSTFNINDDYHPTLRSRLMARLPDGLTFGGISSASGIDMSSRFQASKIVPGSPQEFIMPFGHEIYNMTDSLIDLASQRNTEALRKAGHVWSPSADKFITEDPSLLGEKTGSRGITVNVNNPQRGGFDRNQFDRIVRVAGSYSLRESKDRAISFELDKVEKWEQAMTGSIMKALTNTSDPDYVSKLEKRLMKLNPSPDTVLKFVKAKQDLGLAKNLTQREVASGKLNLMKENGNASMNTLQKLQRDQQFPETPSGQ